MNTKLFSALLSSVLLVGCATTPMPVDKAKITPSERVYLKTQSSPENATVVFIRDEGFLGSGVYQNLTINEEKAAAVDVGEKVMFWLPAGEYLFGVTPTDPFGGAAGFSIDQRIEAKKTYMYRILIDGNSMTTSLQRTLGKLAK